MTDEARFYNNFIDVPPARLYMQTVTGASVTCTPIAESMQARTVAAIVAGADPSASGYEENPSAGMLLEKLVSLVESMRGGYRGAPVEAAINEHGQLVVVEGVHRTSAALALGMPTVPVRVVYRSEAWQEIKWGLRAINDGVRLYQPIAHPDLAWPSWRSDTDARAEILHGHVAPGSAGVEIACHTGGVTFGLARRGHRMAGLDTDARAITVANALRMAPDVGCPDATFATCGTPPVLPSADFVVCLSLLNHHQEDRARWAEGAAIFRACADAAPVVFLDAPAPGDPVGGASEYTAADAVFRWCAWTGAPGAGEVIARRGVHGLQRDLLAWRRE